MAYGFLEHTADMGLWVEAEDLAGLLASAAVSLAEVMVAGPREGPVQWLPLALEEENAAGLLVALLNEVIYRLDGEGLLTVALEPAQVDERRLEGRLGVIPFDPRRHRLRRQVKAATYHQAKVVPGGRGWRAEVILDV